MKHKSLDEIASVAKIVSVIKPSTPVERRQRLNRLADLLDKYGGALRPFRQIEYYGRHELRNVQQEFSPFWVAYQDPQFRQQGLASDRVGDGMAFFGLSARETHQLFCECHYAASANSRQIATNVRTHANRVSLLELCARLLKAVSGRIQQA